MPQPTSRVAIHDQTSEISVVLYTSSTLLDVDVAIDRSLT